MTDIVKQFLDPWCPYDPFLDSVGMALEHLPREDSFTGTRGRLYSMVQEYLLARRKESLEEFFDANGRTPAVVDQVNPPPATIIKLNGICGFYSADRVVIHLYLQAYLDDVMGNAGPVRVLSDKVDLLFHKEG